MIAIVLMPIYVQAFKAIEVKEMTVPLQASINALSIAKLNSELTYTSPKYGLG